MERYAIKGVYYYCLCSNNVTINTISLRLRQKILLEGCYFIQSSHSRRMKLSFYSCKYIYSQLDKRRLYTHFMDEDCAKYHEFCKTIHSSEWDSNSKVAHHDDLTYTCLHLCNLSLLALQGGHQHNITMERDSGVQKDIRKCVALF